MEVKDMHGAGPQRLVITPNMTKAVRKAMVAEAVKTYRADRIAYKATRGTQSAARRASKRPGPVVLRPELVRLMNEQLQAA
jgi:hypothetical protein